MDINIIGGQVGDGGVPHGAILIAFVDAALSFDRQAVLEATPSLEKAVGLVGLIDTAAVAAMFQLNTRAADSAGIPVEAPAVNNRSKIGAIFGFTPRDAGLAP